MTALLGISPPIEPVVTRPELPAGCPLPAACECPEHPSGIVIVLHAGRRGSSDPVVPDLALELRQAGLGTVVVDLTPGSRRERLDPSPALLLVERARRVISWVECQPSLAGLPLGVMGVNGAAAATLAAVAESTRTEAVLVYENQPGEYEGLRKISAPLLRLGAEDAARVASWSAVWFVHHLAMEHRWRCARS
jgi:hypothetical protein